MSNEAIQKGPLSAYDRWELDSFDRVATGQDPSIGQSEAVLMPTPDEIQMIRHQASEKGRSEGLSEGRSEGHSAGYQMGKNQAQEGACCVRRERLRRRKDGGLPPYCPFGDNSDGTYQRLQERCP